MDKSELKKILKPLMKECVREVLMEHGLMKLMAESVNPQQETNTQQKKQQVAQEKPKQNSETEQYRKTMLESIGKSGYLNNQFDPFSGTKPLTESQAASTGPAGRSSNIDPAVLDDPGIDISGFMGNKNTWKALIGGKGK